MKCIISGIEVSEKAGSLGDDRSPERGPWVSVRATPAEAELCQLICSEDMLADIQRLKILSEGQ